MGTEATDALLAEFARLRDAVEELSDGETAPSTTTEPAAPSGGSAGENSTIKAIRAEAKRAEKRAAEAEAEVAELRVFKEATTKREQETALTAAGLSPRQAEVFLKSFEEVTPENVQVFKSEVLGVREEAGEEGTVPSAPFAPTGFVGDSATKPMTRQELDAIAKESPERALELMRSGKVAYRS